MRCNQLKLPIETLSEPKFKVSVESKFMTPAGNFFLNCGICLVCTQKGLPGPFGWKKKAFGLCLPYRGSNKILCFRIWTVFGMLAQTCPWAQSNSVLSGVLREKLRSVFPRSHKLENWPDKADKYLQLQARGFLTNFLKFSNFLKITQVARTKSGNVGSSSKISHAFPPV